MRILVNCPGAWSHGLYSPERGEGRWAQNFSRMLAVAGHDVWAYSGGHPNRPEHLGVKLVGEAHLKGAGKFDMYFDASWWEGKSAIVKADKNFAVIWSLEKRFVQKNLPENMYIGFPFEHMGAVFKAKTNPWRDKTFCLPARYCDEMGEPSFGKKEFIWPSRSNNRDSVSPVIEALNKQHSVHGLVGTWMNHTNIGHYNVWDLISSEIIGKKIDNTPYDELRLLINNASLIIPVESRSSVLDAITLGVAPVAYAGGISFPYLREVAKKHGLLIPTDYTSADVYSVIDILSSNKELYISYVRDLQDNVQSHTQVGSQAAFEEMVKDVYRL
jgi:hypothetical protein